MLRLDPLKIRNLLPMKARQRFYDTLLSRFRKDDDPRAGVITPDDFFMAGEDLESSLDLVAICRNPKS